jgi:hypothetical protein
MLGRISMNSVAGREFRFAQPLAPAAPREDAALSLTLQHGRRLGGPSQRSTDDVVRRALKRKTGAARWPGAPNSGEVVGWRSFVDQSPAGRPDVRASTRRRASSSRFGLLPRGQEHRPFAAGLAFGLVRRAARHVDGDSSTLDLRVQLGAGTVLQADGLDRRG